MPVLMNRDDATSDDDSSGGEPSEPPQPSPASEAVPVDVIDRTRQLQPAERSFLEDGLVRLLGGLGTACDRCVVEVVDDRRMSLMHDRWMNDPSSTDVLTFPMSTPGQPIDADIAVCLPEAERRSHDLDHDRIHELLLYALHGLLHVTGHEDSTDEGFARMHAEEDRLLEQAGFGRLFDSRDSRSGGDRS